MNNMGWKIAVIDYKPVDHWIEKARFWRKVNVPMGNVERLMPPFSSSLSYVEEQRSRLGGRGLD